MVFCLFHPYPQPSKEYVILFHAQKFSLIHEINLYQFPIVLIGQPAWHTQLAHCNHAIELYFNSNRWFGASI